MQQEETILRRWETLLQYEKDNADHVHILKDRCLLAGSVTYHCHKEQARGKGMVERSDERFLKSGHHFGIGLIALHASKFPAAWGLPAYHPETLALIIQIREWWMEGYKKAQSDCADDAIPRVVDTSQAGTGQLLF